eukprot:jgi/Botrbrau1/15863/Bobra.40_1s0047.1
MEDGRGRAHRGHDTIADILGFSCRFPKSDSPSQLWENLIHGRDMTTDDSSRWPAGIHGTPRRFGQLSGLNTFDAGFFSVPTREAEKMEPQMRKLLEVSYEALLDSGLDIRRLAGNQNFGVYVGASGTDLTPVMMAAPSLSTGCECNEGLTSTFSNRLSYIFDFQGPSCTV